MTSARTKSIRSALIAAALGVVTGTGLSYVVDAGDLAARAPAPAPQSTRPVAGPAPSLMLGALAAPAKAA